MASYILRDINRELFERAKAKAKKLVPSMSLKAVIELLVTGWLAEEDDCTCDGGEQGDGLCYVPHAATCPTAIRQKAPNGQS